MNTTTPSKDKVLYGMWPPLTNTRGYKESDTKEK